MARNITCFAWLRAAHLLERPAHLLEYSIRCALGECSISPTGESWIYNPKSPPIKLNMNSNQKGQNGNPKHLLLSDAESSAGGFAVSGGAETPEHSGGSSAWDSVHMVASIQSTYSETRAYTPGRLRSAQPIPQDVIPTMRSPCINGPEEESRH